MKKKNYVQLKFHLDAFLTTKVGDLITWPVENRLVTTRRRDVNSGTRKRKISKSVNNQVCIKFEN